MELDDLSLRYLKPDVYKELEHSLDSQKVRREAYIKEIDPKKNQTIMGTGLGLSISKKLTELMGSSITVESEYEKGSTFIVTIPQEICLAAPMIPPSDKMEQAEVYVYLLESDKELTKYVIRELHKLSIHPSLISSVSSISLDRSI